MTSKVLSASLHSLWEILLEGSLEISRRNMPKQIVHCFAWITSTTWSQSIFMEFFRKHHIIRERFLSLFLNNYQVYWEVLFRNNIIFVYFVKEMKILLLYKNESLLCGGYKMSEKNTATRCDLKKKEMMSLYLPFVHSSSNMCEMYVFLFFRLANFM